MTTGNEIRAPRGHDDGIRRRTWAACVWERRWFVVIVTAVFCVAGLACAFLPAPVYQATAVVQVTLKVLARHGQRGRPPMRSVTAPTVRSEARRIGAHAVVGHAVDALDLAIDATPRRLPVVGGFVVRHFHPRQPGAVARPWFGLRRYAFGGARIDIERLHVPAALIGARLALVAGDNRTFTLRDESGAPLLHGQAGTPASGHGVTVDVRRLDAYPGTAFTVVRQSRGAAIAQVQARLAASAASGNSSVIIVHYRDTDPTRAKAVLRAIVEQYKRLAGQRAAANAAQRAKFVSDQLPGVHARLQTATEALAAYAKRKPDATLSSKSSSLLGQAVAVGSHLAQLRLLRAEAEQEFDARAGGYATLERRIGTLETRRTTLERQIAGLSDTQRTLLQLTLDVRLAGRLNTFMQSQLQQWNGAGSKAFVHILAKARVNPARPVKPRRVAIVVVAVLVGLFASIAWVLTRRALSGGIRERRDIETLGLTVHACIPFSASQRGVERRRATQRSDAEDMLHVLAMDAPADLAIEAIRSLRASVHLSVLQADNNVVMLSAARAGAGTSFVAANLAVVIARAGRRVLLVDGDLRHGTLHHIFGDAEVGLGDVLEGAARLGKAVCHTPIDGLDFIARGTPTSDPSELLANVNFTAIVKTLAPRHDLVIIDTPPIGTVDDARIIGRHAGTRLLVARYGMSRIDALERASQRFAQHDVELTGAVLNAVAGRGAGNAFGANPHVRADRT